jgi:hypothetical protein
MFGKTFFTFDFFLFCLAREVLPECKKIKNIFFLQILVSITLISNFNYKNQEKIFLGKSIKHMWQHQKHALEVKQNKLPLYICSYLIILHSKELKRIFEFQNEIKFRLLKYLSP